MLSEIARKDTGCFTHEDDFWDEAVFASQLPDEHHLFLAGVSEGGVWGYICMMHVLDEAEVVRIGVFPPYRGLGLGERLLREGIARCAEMGAGEINLEVRQSNTAARALYEKLGPDTGFDCIGTTSGTEGLVRFLDMLDHERRLPKTIIYSSINSSVCQYF